MAKKYVIVGANTDIYGEFESILGAQKSALEWKSYLDEIGFEQKEIFTDINASRTNILSALASLFSSLNKDDFAVFIYVGHGKRINNQDSILQDETDGKDEALVCNGTLILDDEIRSLLNLNKNKAPVFILIDACFSGIVEKNYQVLTISPDKNEIAFSSTSQKDEAYMEDRNHIKQAVYSTFLLNILKEHKFRNYDDIFNLTKEALKKENYPQIPQLTFTNPCILANRMFSTPLDLDKQFSIEQLKEIEKDSNKGQTQIEKVVTSFILSKYKINIHKIINNYRN